MQRRTVVSDDDTVKAERSDRVCLLLIEDGMSLRAIVPIGSGSSSTPLLVVVANIERTSHLPCSGSRSWRFRDSERVSPSATGIGTNMSGVPKTRNDTNRRRDDAVSLL